MIMLGKRQKENIKWAFFSTILSAILSILLLVLSGCYTKAGNQKGRSKAYIVAVDQASSSNNSVPNYLVKAKRKNKKWQEIREEQEKNDRVRDEKWMNALEKHLKVDQDEHSLSNTDKNRNSYDFQIKRPQKLAEDAIAITIKSLPKFIIIIYYLDSDDEITDHCEVYTGGESILMKKGQRFFYDKTDISNKNLTRTISNTIVANDNIKLDLTSPLSDGKRSIIQ